MGAYVARVWRGIYFPERLCNRHYRLPSEEQNPGFVGRQGPLPCHAPYEFASTCEISRHDLIRGHGVLQDEMAGGRSRWRTRTAGRAGAGERRRQGGQGRRPDPVGVGRKERAGAQIDRGSEEGEGRAGGN